MKYHTYRSPYTRLYYLTLLGGEFANCHGQGKTLADAINSLKFSVNWMRRKRDAKTS